MNRMMMRIGFALVAGIWLVAVPASAQSLFSGTLENFSNADVGGVADVLAGEMDGQAGKYAGWGVAMITSAADLVRDVGPLSDEDGAYDPMGLDDDFQAPSECAEDAACLQCYEEAVARIDFNRYYLHRAWSITDQYTKFAEGAMAFGDSASGIHGMAGMSWQLQGKPPIKQALGGLRKTYREKYSAYVEGLEGSLKQLGECEAQHAGADRWFGRYAGMYVSMVRDRYRIAD
ncbi:hypothetical protein [Pseudoxanthomonas koreensis]|uniref:hypothetical protein n=1 Tax=Pseudoxanthomonas koreensis TaxID=266061 RepID=UPI0035A5EA40